MTWNKLMKAKDLQGRQGNLVDGVAVFEIAGDVYAIDDECAHQGGPLSDGTFVDDYIVACPWHGWAFDIRTGECVTHDGRVGTYEAKIDDEHVYIKRQTCSNCNCEEGQ